MKSFLAIIFYPTFLYQRFVTLIYNSSKQCNHSNIVWKSTCPGNSQKSNAQQFFWKSWRLQDPDFNERNPIRKIYLKIWRKIYFKKSLFKTIQEENINGWFCKLRTYWKRTPPTNNLKFPWTPNHLRYFNLGWNCVEKVH